MKTLSLAIVLLLMLVPQSCSVKGNTNTNEYYTETVEEDSLNSMIEFIGYVDSMHLVEDVSESYIEMKKKNEELETKLKEVMLSK